MELTEGLKKILLAGIGAAATTVEKGQEILSDMVEKGEITVEQGKTLNKELKHTISKSGKKEEFSEKLANLSEEELEELEKQVADAKAAAAARAEEKEKEEKKD